jgi:hypothetical protein
MNRQYEIQTEIGNRFFPEVWNARIDEVSLHHSIKSRCLNRKYACLETLPQPLSSYSTDFCDAFDVDRYTRFPNMKPALFCAFSIFRPGDRAFFSG